LAERRLDVALLAYGGPQAPEEVVPFLRRLMGRAPSADTIAAVQERYALIGGASPLPAITARQARALQTELEQRRDESYRQRACAVRVRHGFLFSDPSVAECLRQLDADEIVAVPLSPFSSRLTSGRYTEQIAAAEAASGRGRTIPLLEGWYASPGFLRAVARRITASLDGCAADEWALLFTAHSVPAETIAAGDLYAEQLDEAIAALLPLLDYGGWRFGFQSKGRGGGEWTEPEVADAVRALAAEGWRRVLVVPLGFVSDNVETLYDLDVVVREQCEALGLEYRRSEAPNDSPQFISTLAEVVMGHLAEDCCDG